MKKLFTSLVIGGLLFSLAGKAGADSLTYEITGTVTSISGSTGLLDGIISEGDTVTGVFTFFQDTILPDQEMGGHLYINFNDLILLDGVNEFFIGNQDGSLTVGGMGGQTNSNLPCPPDGWFEHQMTILNPFDVYSASGSFTLAYQSMHSGVYQIDTAFSAKPNAPVPEPATMLLFGTGIAGLAGTRLRRKKSA